MIRLLPITIAFGLASAVLYAAALGGSAFGVLLAYLAQLPLFAAGLAMGAQAAMIAGAAAVLGMGVMGGISPGVIYAATTALPVAFLVSLALRKRTWTDGQDYWYPAGNLLRATALWCAAVLIAIAIALNLLGSGFKASIIAMIESFTTALAEGTGQGISPAAVEGMAGILPGITAWSWMIMATVNGLLAQAIVKRAGSNLRPSLRMADIDIPMTWTAGFAALVLAGIFLPADLGFTAINLAVVLAYPLLMQGLSVVHAAFAHWGVPTAGYVAFYVVIIVLGWLGLALLALGLAEPLLKLRDRFSRPRTT